MLTRFILNSSAILSLTLLWITSSLTLLLWMSWIYYLTTILTIGFQPLTTNRTTNNLTLISRLFIQCYLRLGHVVHGSKVSILSKIIHLKANPEQPIWSAQVIHPPNLRTNERQHHHHSLAVNPAPRSHPAQHHYTRNFDPLDLSSTTWISML